MLLYLAEGAPIGFVWWYLAAVLRQEGVELTRITTLQAILALPWALKFAWAPAVDVMRGRHWGHRAWIGSMQFLMGLSLLPVAWLDLEAQFGWVFGCVVLHALAATTQDVAIDAYAIRIAPPDERGRLNGFMQAGMFLGRWLFGAGALLVADRVDRATVVPVLVCVIWGIMALLLFCRDIESTSHAWDEVAGRWSQFVSVLGRVLTKPVTWIGLAIALISGAGFEAVGVVAGPLLVDLEMESQTIGLFYTLSVMMTLMGGLIGGWIADRIGHRRAVAGFLVLLAGLIAVLSTVLKNPWMAYGMLILIYFGIGLFVTATYALFMDLTDPRLGATQFSAYMGATNGCEAWSALAAGYLIAAQGLPHRLPDHDRPLPARPAADPEPSGQR